MNTRSNLLAASRGIHLIDVENLCGTSLPSLAQVKNVRLLYESVVPVGGSDHIVVASAHANLLAAALGWPSARYLARSGKNGADIRLAEIMMDEQLAERFEFIYIASGDGGLAPFIAELGGRGAHTIAVSRPQSLSPRIRLAATETLYLPNPIAILTAIA